MREPLGLAAWCSSGCIPRRYLSPSFKKRWQEIGFLNINFSPEKVNLEWYFQHRSSLVLRNPIILPNTIMKILLLDCKHIPSLQFQLKQPLWSMSNKIIAHFTCVILILSGPPMSRAKRVRAWGRWGRGVLGVGKVQDCRELSVDNNHKQEDDEDT